MILLNTTYGSLGVRLYNRRCVGNVTSVVTIVISLTDVIGGLVDFDSAAHGVGKALSVLAVLSVVSVKGLIWSFSIAVVSSWIEYMP